jgi:D-glycero-D-manno-heptose 1,7-bisphosphate phosphatase
MPEPAKPRRAVFFDRDGVLNIDTGYVWRPEKFLWRPTAKATIKRLNDRGILVFVVTNQSGVARGFYTEDDVRALHAHVQAELAQEGAHVDDFRFCPHHPDGKVEPYRRECDCRKPASGMILDLIAAWNVDPALSRMFGDKDSDLEAGLGAGVTSHLVTDEQPLIELVSAAFTDL